METDTQSRFPSMSSSAKVEAFKDFIGSTVNPTVAASIISALRDNVSKEQYSAIAEHVFSTNTEFQKFVAC